MSGNTPTAQPMFALPANDRDGELGYSTSGCSSYAGSPASISTSYGAHSPTPMQSSMISCHPLLRNLGVYSPPPAYLESEYCSIREASSIGDSQQGVQQNQWSNSAIIESMNRATPYSPEEKKERIERYRSKRTLRNFNKKIKYECRKTLADSRPRVRGRFARNGEIAKASQSQWDDEYYVEEDDYNWISMLDALIH